MEKQIDMIIPAYKAHKTIFKTLCSLAMQTVSNIIQVTVVNDCCPEGSYQSIIDQFKGQLDINEIILPENHGPGYARQYGIDHTSCPYIMFADADDTYMCGFTISEFYNRIKELKEDVIFSNFIEQNNTGFISHETDIVWVFGKIYRRQFLVENKIGFTANRANEDTCFNRKVKLKYQDKDKHIKFLDSYTYLWNNQNNNSITRINHSQYQYDQSIIGFVDGVIEMFDWAKKRKIKKSILIEEIIGTMIFLYFTYCDVGSYTEVFQEQNLEYVKKFYNKIWKAYNMDYHDKRFIDGFTENLKIWCIDDNRVDLAVFMAQPNIVQFMDMLADLPYNENDIYEIQAKLPDEVKQKNIECGVCSKDYYDKKK